jgi:hypothetical protein
MALRDAVAQLVATCPPGSLIPVDWLAVQLEADSGAGEQLGAPDASVDLTVHAVAGRFNKSDSTIRTWLGRGEFPGAYLLHDKEWRIPLAAVEAMQRAAAKRHTTPTPRTTRPPRTTDLSEWRKHMPSEKTA